MTDIVFCLARRDDAGRLNLALSNVSEDLGDRHHADEATLAATGWGDHPVFRALLGEAGGQARRRRALLAQFLDRAWISDHLCFRPLGRGAGAGSGIGRRLLAKVHLDAAETRNARSMKLNVYHAKPRASRFYRRLGFRPATHHSEMHLDSPGCTRQKGAV